MHGAAQSHSHGLITRHSWTVHSYRNNPTYNRHFSRATFTAGQLTRTRVRMPPPTNRGEGRSRASSTAVHSALAVPTMPAEKSAAEDKEVHDARPLCRLIDVDRPYLRFSSLQITGNTVHALVERESDVSSELHTPMAFAEICRHIANVGEIACAAANPVKRRHFYLAITGSFELVMAPGAKDRAELTHAIEIEATVTSFKKGTASVGIQVYTPGVDGSPRQIYALMKVLYMVMPEEAFKGQFMRGKSPCADMAAIKKQALDLGSPYEDPICLKDIQAPSAHVRTAKLAFEDPFMTPGHFPDVPALPATTVQANAMQLLAVGFGDNGRPLRYTVVKGKMNYKRLPLLGETLLLTCTDTGGACRRFEMRAVGAHDGKEVMLSIVHIAEEGDDLSQRCRAAAPASKL